MRQYLVTMTDSHAGHLLGLMPPDVTLFQVGINGNIVPRTPKQTAMQEYLWYDVYIPAVKKLDMLTKGDPIVGIHAGDPTHGIKHPEQLVTTSIADHVQIAVENMAPLLQMQNMRAFRFVMGTDVHEFGEGSASVLVAANIKNIYHGLDVGVVAHGLASVGGVTIDYAHHGPPPGARSWLHGNVARYYLRDQMLIHLTELGKVPPDIFLRGHVHEYVHEVLRQDYSDGECWSRLVVIPSMCGLSSFARKTTRSHYILRNGLVVFVLENERIVDVIPYIEKMDLRTKEQI